MQDLIQKAKEWALSEIELNKIPAKELWDISNQVGQELADKLGANKEIVMLGTILMDIKLGESRKQGKDHVVAGVDATKEFLNQFELDSLTKENIINCVEAHHGTVEYKYKEAEICANADCYRFLTPKGVFQFFKVLSLRESDFNKILDQVEFKLEEKYNVLTLDICKQELEPYYKMFKDLIQKAREA